MISRKYSLTKVISVLLLLSFLIVFVVISAVFYLDKSSMLETVSHAQIRSHSYELQKEFEDYINLPIMANAAIANAVDQHDEADIPAKDISHVLQHVMNEIYKNEPDLKNVQYGSIFNKFAGIDHDPRFSDREFLTVSNDETNNILTSFETLSEKSKVTMTLPNYNMKDRPWFKDVYETKKASWSPVFMDLDKFKQLGVAYNSPAFNKKGMFIGVISSELYLPDLNKKLINLKPYKESALIITDDKNRIFASSDPELTKIQGSDTSYLLPMEKAPENIRTIAEKLSVVDPSHVIRVNVDGAEFYASKFPVSDADNKMKMQVMIIVPVQTVLSTLQQHNIILIISLLLLFTVTLFFMRKILSLLTSPLQRMVSRMTDFERDDWDESPKTWYFREIDDLENGFRELALKLKGTLKNLHEKIEIDPVTGLHTQSGLVKNEKLYQNRNVMVLIHLSNTKSIINTLGEVYADEMLCKLVSKFKEKAPSDTLIARLKQDKLLIVFPGRYSPDAVKKCSDIILSLLSSDKADDNDQDHPFYGVAGMVIEDITHENAETLMKNAWIALNAIDSKSRGGVSLYSEDMRKKEYRNIRIYDHLRNAIAHDELYLVLQPIVEKQKDIICNTGECLLRWRNDELGQISPADFIPVAEESGLIVSLGEWVIEEACRELSALIKRGGPKDFTLHVNVSPLQLISKGFAFHLLDHIAQNGLHASNICIEITEGVMVNDIDRVITVLNYLRRHGVTVSLDDFGTGFSGLSYLHTLPFDSIKIDAAFFKNGIDEKNTPLISAMIALGKGYNVSLIAEGIESADIYETLNSMGCTVYQGYYFARPDVFSSWHCEGNVFHLNNTDHP